MPKTSKTQPKPHSKNQHKKTQLKAQPKSASLLKSKYYWIFVSLIVLVFTVAYGYLIQISLGKEVLILGSIFMVIGFAFYIGFKPYPSNKKRAVLILIGASIIGFSIWAVMVLSLNATGLLIQILSSIGDSFFAITSLIICLVAGAFIGDLIGKNIETVLGLAHKFRSRVSYSAPRKE